MRKIEGEGERGEARKRGEEKEKRRYEEGYLVQQAGSADRNGGKNASISVGK